MSETNRGDNTPSVQPRGTGMAIPAAIIVGFALIAISIYLSGGKEVANTNVNQNEQVENKGDIANITPVNENDHIRGNPNAPLVIVEYSDFDCPFCKTFHTTMQQIMDEYGPTGEVAWVYRHLPLTSLHPSAAHIAEASECVAELGGSEAFWKFADMVFGERGVNDLTNIALLPEFAVSAGVSETDYKACMDSARNRPLIEEDVANAISIGARGTPHSIVIAGDQMMVINGAQPYDQVKLLVDGLLR
ncbi:thioredoxin domain-containing protein [Candidatus Nomurabacteria bacterium]|nr:thioredoxin domain-containing protein [Candidatus Nomurabacteria bacterium]MCB9819101.1 thioredoxin domain-containing protein [Candidatus Nomurabacteria bacterium]